MADVSISGVIENKTTRLKGKNNFLYGLSTILLNMSLRLRIWSVVALLGFISVAFEAKTLIEARQTTQQMQRVASITAFVPSVSNLIHEMQVERGRSAQYLGSGGEATIGRQLSDQYAKTDKMLSIFNTTYMALQASDEMSGFLQGINVSRAGLTQLSGIRSAVQSQQNTVTQMADYYTGTIATMIDIIKVLSREDVPTALATKVNSYLSLVQLKERTGLERAMGANGFGRGFFEPAVYNKFIALGAMQETYENAFNTYASDQNRRLLSSVLQGTAAQDVQRMRDIVLRTEGKVADAGISSASWFQAITNKINELQAVETTLANDVSQLANAIQKEADSTLMTLIVIVFGLLLVVSYLVVNVIDSIVRPLIGLEKAVDSINSGDYHAQLPECGKANVIASIGDAIVNFRDTSAQRQKESSLALEAKGKLDAVSKSQAVIEFSMDGIVLDANENFLAVMGYTLEDIKGKHHRMFVDPVYAESADYKAMWDKLGRGEYDVAEYKRIGKGGKEIWIQASYNPIHDQNGKPFKVVKFATDVSEQKLRNADFSGQIAAIGKSQAVIAFNMDGIILDANDNFLKTLGYSLDEIVGKHHRIFADPAYAASEAYEEFWQKLKRGAYDTGEYKRFGKGGKEVWIQASYNPILDLNGKPFKIVKYATDITQQKIEAEENAHNARIKVALDSANTNVMIADNDLTIFYMNENMQTMAKQLESDFKKDLPAFDADALIGTNIDIFHKEPSHQRSMLAALKSTHRAQICISDRIFNLVASPVVDSQGNRFGTSVEWEDVTQEVRIEEEIKSVVDAAVEGNLSQRIDLSGKAGFMLNVSDGINLLAEVCEAGLKDISVMLNSMASGDLTKRITNDYSGIFEELKQNSNATADKLSEVMASIIMGAGEVSNASTEIASGSADLSQRTEEQASSLEETAASMEEMESTVKTNADNALEANKMGTNARSVAEKGGEVVERAVSAMSRIEDSSQKISDIIVVIDEIAFQTNLLALNAAVEAARAGDAGKGFAVVASEVRALAQRSSEAAKDIKGLINDSNHQVKDGVELVNEAGQQLKEIVMSIKSVTTLVSDIANANQEQATGVAEINRAVSEMDEMTQQNSALVEETAASARSLEEQAEDMMERISFFKIDDDKGLAPPSSPKAHLNRTPTRAKVRAKAPIKAKQVVAAVDDDEWAEF